MQILLLTQALCAILLAVSFDTDAKPNGLRIIKGQEVEQRFFPFITHVKIYKYCMDEKIIENRKVKQLVIKRFVCGGSIITKYHVLTAAHCVYPEGPELWFKRAYDVRPENVTVFEGVNHLTDIKEPQERGVRIHPVRELRHHESYNPRTNEHDIALLTLHYETVHGRVCLHQPIHNWSNLVVNTLGWGITTENGVFSNALKMLTSTVTYPQRNPGLLITDTLNGIAAGGDSGGPVVRLTHGGTFLVGIVSGPMISRIDSNGLTHWHTWGRGYTYRNTNVPNYQQWILSSIYHSSQKDMPCFSRFPQ